MHPSAAFTWSDRQQMLEFVNRHPFAHIFSAYGPRLAVVHAPLLVTAEGRVQFHLSRRNRAADQIAGNRLLVSIVGREAYQSANWYDSADQVPTWLYESVEIEGSARLLTDEELTGLLDDLTALFEARHSPEKPWTRAKMTGGSFEAMTRAIVGFELEPAEFRGTRKFNQHKSDADMRAAMAGQKGAKRPDIVQAIMEARTVSS
jgi:transcriptional regulator